jgi:hypothetical protein
VQNADKVSLLLAAVKVVDNQGWPSILSLSKKAVWKVSKYLWSEVVRVGSILSPNR